MEDAAAQPQPDDPPAASQPAGGGGATRVQSVSCGRCGWPSVCVAQEGMRLLSFVCHWCGKTTVGVVDPTIKRTVIF